MTFDQLCAANYRFPTVALFYGSACAPCEHLKPKLREVCKKMSARLEEFNSAFEMDAIRKLGFRTVPAVVVVMPDGTVRHAFMGNQDDIQALLLAAGVGGH